MDQLIDIRQTVDCVIYHNPCQDGLCSAWVIKKLNPNVLLIPKAINNELIDESLYIDKNVIMVDIVTSDFLEIKGKAKNLVILDHHKTNQNRLKNVDNAYFDMHKSGVGLAWQYVFLNKTLPKFLDCIQDRDLWTWTIPQSKAFCDGFYNIGIIDTYFKLLDDLYDEWLNDKTDIFDRCCEIGNILNKIKMAKIKQMVNDKILFAVTLPNSDISNPLNAAFYNCSHDIASDLGNYAINNTRANFIVMWRYIHDKDEYWYSLRSNDKNADVSAICELFGGGGHRNAAGFSSKLHPKELFTMVQI